MADPAPVMSRNAFGATGLYVAPIALSSANGLSASEVERAFYELGVNYFFMTLRGENTVIALRNLIKAGHRDALVIASGITVPIAARVESSCDEDRKRFGVDSIDVWQMMWVRARWHLSAGVYKKMQKLKERGAVKLLGMSIHDRQLTTSLTREFALDALMLRYNAAHRGIVPEVFEPLGASCPPVVAYTSTRWGSLLQKPDGFDHAMDPGDCYRYVLNHPNVRTVLCAPSHYSELEHNARRVALGPLVPAEVTEIERIGDAVRKTQRVVSTFGWGGD
ncbi:MAG: aldo/keto reductase [Deltaproteobacteria bacterium]|nr:aldo/keto reductase [Deltaproteobacteria bacterium]